MVLFSKGMGLKNDVFCLISFLTPLDVSKTSTNIWKHLGIFQNPSEDSKNTKIGLKNGRKLKNVQKSDFSASFQSRLWPFSGIKSVPCDQNGTGCAPSKVLWCPDSIPQVYRSIGHKKWKKVEKYAKI